MLMLKIVENLLQRQIYVMHIASHHKISPEKIHIQTCNLQS